MVSVIAAGQMIGGNISHNQKVWQIFRIFKLEMPFQMIIWDMGERFRDIKSLYKDACINNNKLVILCMPNLMLHLLLFEFYRGFI